MQKSSIQNGLFMGIAMIISSYALYLANPSMFLSAKTLVLLLIFIILLVKSGLDARKGNGGFISFKSAFFNLFVTGAIGTLICTIFDYIHFNMLAPELIDMMKEIQLEAAEQMSGILGSSPEMEEIMEESMDQIEDSNPASLGTMAMGYGIKLILTIPFFSAIISAIIKKDGGFNPPEKLDDDFKYTMKN